MKINPNQPLGIFGIENSNRTPENHWGKNCFNSSFPTAIACYMLDHKLTAVYNRLEIVKGELRVVASEIPLQDVFRSGGLSVKDLNFNFESRFEPYQKYSFNTIDAIDLVVKANDGKFLSPLEIKLTVLPDSSTAKKPEEKWGSEIVVAPPQRLIVH